MGREGKGRKGREKRRGEANGGRGRERGKGRGKAGREGTPNILLHPPVPVF